MRTEVELEKRWIQTDPEGWRDRAQRKAQVHAAGRKMSEGEAGGTMEPGEAIRTIVSCGANGGKSQGRVDRLTG